MLSASPSIVVRTRTPSVSSNARPTIATIASADSTDTKATTSGMPAATSAPRTSRSTTSAAATPISSPRVSCSCASALNASIPDSSPDTRSSKPSTSRPSTAATSASTTATSADVSTCTRAVRPDSATPASTVGGVTLSTPSTASTVRTTSRTAASYAGSPKPAEREWRMTVSSYASEPAERWRVSSSSPLSDSVVTRLRTSGVTTPSAWPASGRATARAAAHRPRVSQGRRAEARARRPVRRFCMGGSLIGVAAHRADRGGRRTSARGSTASTRGWRTGSAWRRSRRGVVIPTLAPCPPPPRS